MLHHLAGATIQVANLVNYLEMGSVFEMVTGSHFRRLVDQGYSERVPVYSF